MISFRRFGAISLLILLVFGLGISVRAAGEVDTSFRASLTRAFGSGSVRQVAVQPDGKILIAGTLGLVNGVFRSRFARLNPDGTVDQTFAPPVVTSAQFEINVIAFQPGGKILVGGDFATASRQTLMRLNSDGSLDPTFADIFPLGSNSSGTTLDIAFYPDGRLLIGGSLQVRDLPGGQQRSNLIRTDANGNIDLGFEFTETAVRRSLILPDGKLIVSSFFSSLSEFHTIWRRNSDGSRDMTFTPNGATNLTGMALLADGKILISSMVGSQLRRINIDGTSDLTFPDPGISGAINVMIPDASGKFFIGGDFTQLANNTSYKKVARLNGDGTADLGFVYSGHNFQVVNDLAIQPDGKIVVGGTGVTTNFTIQNPIARANTDGTTDSSFHVPIAVNFGIGYKVLVQPDNKVLVGGAFEYSNGIKRTLIVRFNVDGTVDTGFTSPNYNQGVIWDLALQPDGKILVVGTYGVVNRLNPNGTLDLAFPFETVNRLEIEPMPDGRILVGGEDLRRYTAAGVYDDLTVTIAGGSNARIWEIALQADGKIIVGGSFTGRIFRLSASGSADASFTPQVNGDVFAIVPLPDGKILIGGTFTSVDGDNTKQYLARLNANGTLDSSFSVALNAPVFGLKVQPDGRILIGGAMSHVNGILMPRLARISAGGSLDLTFNVGTGPDSTVWSVDQASDGKVLFSGECVRTNGFATPGIGRLLNTAVPVTTPFDYDGDDKSDVSVFRASENKWYILRSSDSTVYQPVFAVAGDLPVPADYDGDQKTDVAIFRPSSGQWWYLSSIDGSFVLNPFGANGDVPRPSDFDGDGKTDFVIFRPSNNTWYRFGSLTHQEAPPVVFGAAGDQPLVGDFDGDGKSDVAIFRPSAGDWWYAASSAGGAFRQTHWGQNGDLPVPADYDGDGKTDNAVFRPSDGGWYVLNSSNGSFTTTAFGTSGDRPVAADYDGDGRADLAVFRPSTGIWYLLRSTSGFAGLQFGISTDTPTQSAYVP